MPLGLLSLAVTVERIALFTNVGGWYDFDSPRRPVLRLLDSVLTFLTAFIAIT
jgi:hypothetical protein